MKHRLAHSTLGLVALLSGAMALGCSSAYQRPTVMQDLERRAAFDLACKTGALRLEVLEESRGYFPREPLVVGARGCGARVTYVRQNGSRAGWATASLSPANKQTTCGGTNK